MADYKIRAAIAVLIVVLACVLSCAVSTKAVARGPVIAEVTADDVRVGGEPGEDPHLKLTPAVQTAEDWKPVGASGRSSGGGLRTENIGSDCPQEGLELSLCSRINQVWRMMLQAWLRTTLR
jgi:hypothetical protein